MSCVTDSNKLCIEVVACCATCNERLGTYEHMKCKLTGDPFPVLPHYKCDYYVDMRSVKEWWYDLDKARGENEDKR